MLVNHIYSGDCIEVLNTKIDPGSVHLIFADPPYNLSGKKLEWEEKSFTKINESWDTIPQEEYNKFTHNWIQASHKALTSNGSIYICASYHNLGEILVAVKTAKFKINNVIVWSKTNAMPSLTTRTFTHSSEFIIWAVKGSNWVFNYEKMKEINPDKQKNGSLKQMRDVWAFPLCAGKERLKNAQGKSAHPSQKPEILVERAILASSNPGQLVLDPFLGSGTTAAVAQKHNRHYIGIEKDPVYLELIAQRLKKLKQ